MASNQGHLYPFYSPSLDEEYSDFDADGNDDNFHDSAFSESCSRFSHDSGAAGPPPSLLYSEQPMPYTWQRSSDSSSSSFSLIPHRQTTVTEEGGQCNEAKKNREPERAGEPTPQERARSRIEQIIEREQRTFAAASQADYWPGRIPRTTTPPIRVYKPVRTRRRADGSTHQPDRTARAEGPVPNTTPDRPTNVELYRGEKWLGAVNPPRQWSEIEREGRGGNRPGGTDIAKVPAPTPAPASSTTRSTTPPSSTAAIRTTTPLSRTSDNRARELRYVCGQVPDNVRFSNLGGWIDSVITEPVLSSLAGGGGAGSSTGPLPAGKDCALTYVRGGSKEVKNTSMEQLTVESASTDTRLNEEVVKKSTTKKQESCQDLGTKSRVDYDPDDEEFEIVSRSGETSDVVTAVGNNGDDDSDGDDEDCDYDEEEEDRDGWVELEP